MATLANAPNNPQLTAQVYANDILDGIHAPKTDGNIRLLVAWMGGEGTTARFNPLATTQPANGATTFNSVGVKNYPDYSTGVSATVQTLQNGYYPGIVNDLRKGNVPPEQIIQNNQKEFATWGTGAGLVGRVLATTPGGNNNGGGGGGFSPLGFLEGAGKTAILAGEGVGGAAIGIIPGVGSSISGILGLDDAAKKVVYAASIMGGGLTILVGLILVGVDLGIAGKAAGKTPPVRAARRVRNAFGPSGASNRELSDAYKQGQKQGEIQRAKKAGRRETGRKSQGAVHPETGDDIPF